jgi:hypothetical protein
LIVIVLLLTGGLGAINGVPYGYGMGHGGIGLLGLILIIVVVMVLLGRL